jgi:hypothetical protein
MPSIGPVPECLNRPSRQECADRFPEKFFLNGGDLAVGIKSQRKDWTGQRFGRLVAVSFVGRRRVTTLFGFLGAIAVQSTGHQFRMLLAKTAPFVRVDVCIVRLPASTSERTVMRVCERGPTNHGRR